MIRAGFWCFLALAAGGVGTAWGQAPSYRQVHAFAGGSDDDGALPQAALIAVGTTVVGVTDYGNDQTRCDQIGFGCGTVFSLTSDGGEQILYAFKGDALSTVTDGAVPFATLLNVGGTLYGTTFEGGPTSCPYRDGCGTVFRLAAGGSETVLHGFSGGADGNSPSGGLIAIGSTLYGTTSSGGAFGDGTVFSLAADGTETVLHSFAGGSDGASPVGTLLDVGGTLYGATTNGGLGGHACDGGCGTIFSITPSGTETLVYRFRGGSGGYYPTGGLAYLGGELYGTTHSGGDEGDGLIFWMTPTGLVKGYSAFAGSNGTGPAGGLVAMGGTLYGTTNYGGLSPCSCGTVFSLTPGGTITTAYSFQGGSDGQTPSAGLLAVGTTLYGTTEYGGGGSGCFGTNGCGTVFALKP